MPVRIWPARRRAATPALDLAIVAELLGASGQIGLPGRIAFVGEVHLNGAVSAIPVAEAARGHEIEKLVIPAASAAEAALVAPAEIVPLTSIAEFRKPARLLPGRPRAGRTSPACVACPTVARARSRQSRPVYFRGPCRRRRRVQLLCSGTGRSVGGRLHERSYRASNVVVCICFSVDPSGVCNAHYSGSS
jgi:hypothetical protein